MKNKWTNDVTVSGYVFNFGNNERRQLKRKVTGENSKNPGQEYLQGEINIATDDDATNVVTVWFQYVPATWPAKGDKPERENKTFTDLVQLLENGRTYEQYGTGASKVRINGEFETNDFFDREGKLASPKRIKGNFVHSLNGNIPSDPATFKIEGVLTGVSMREVEDGDDYVIVKGYGFNFRNEIMPFEVNVRSQSGMYYFLDNDYPMVTTVWGNIVSTTVQRKTTVEGAFGDPEVKITESNIRSWDVVNASLEKYSLDDDMYEDETITKEYFKKLLQERENRLAEEKARQDEYQASRNGKSAFPIEKKETKNIVEDDEEDDDDFDFGF